MQRLLDDKLHCLRLLGMSSSITFTSGPKLTLLTVCAGQYCFYHIVLFHPNPEEDEVVQKTTQWSNKTTLWKNSIQSLSDKKINYSTITFSCSRGKLGSSLPFIFYVTPSTLDFSAVFTFTYITIHQTSVLRHILIVVNLSFGFKYLFQLLLWLFYSIKGKTDTTGTQTYSRESMHFDCVPYARLLATPAPVLCWKATADFIALTKWILPTSPAGKPGGTLESQHNQI